MERLKFIQTHATLGDETAPYRVEFQGPLTVADLMDFILNRRCGEWGRIYLGNEARVEYRYGKIMKGSYENIKHRLIESVDAHGGWSLMDYTVYLK